MRKIAVLLCFLSMGCVSYTLITPEKTNVAGVYSVDPDIPWNALTGGVDGEKNVIWTVDGLLLHQLRFITGLEDGEKLFGGKFKEKMPPYKSGMTPVEVVEMMEGAFAAMDLRSIKTRGLRPQDFANIPGFRFEFSHASKDGLEWEGFAVGAIRDKALYMIFYTGAKMHYFPKYKGNVERIIETMTLL